MSYKILTLTQGCFNNNYLGIKDAKDLFPKDAIGGSNKSLKGNLINLNVGMQDKIITDVDDEHNIFRNRSWFNEFARIHNLKVGDKVVIHKVGDRSFHIYPKV